MSHFLMANTVTIISIVCATFLAYHGKAGWGWLIFIAICCAHSFSGDKQ